MSQDGSGLEPLHMTEFLRGLPESPDLHGINSADNPCLDNLLPLSGTEPPGSGI